MSCEPEHRGSGLGVEDVLFVGGVVPRCGLHSLGQTFLNGGAPQARNYQLF